MKNKSELITIAFTALCLMVFPILLIALPKKEFSDNENRNLASFPELSVKAFISGDFMDGINDYLTDHFPFRDFWISMKSETEILTGKRKINGIYIAKDGYLIGEYQDTTNTDMIKNNFKNFSDNALELNDNLVMRLMLVPTSVTVNAELLPKGHLNISQLDVIDEITEYTGITPVNVYETLMTHRDEQLFYRTDHHWTTKGAYYAYIDYCKSVGLEPVSLDKLDSQVITTDFHGTYSSKVNRPGEKGDEIVIYTNPEDVLTVNYTDTNEITDSLYEMSYVDKKDKYSLFLNNLHTLVEITNENAETDRVLLIVKDSYANSMLPFLATNYKKIYVVDTRYYKFGPSALIDEHSDITDVLILYNMSTIDTDTGIRGIF